MTKYAQPITLKWTRTQTSRLLLEGGMAVGRTLFHNGYRESVTPAFDIETIQNTPIYAITDISNNRSFGASIVGYMAFGGTMKVGRFATTYVTGSHALKTGVEYGVGHGPNGARNWYTGDVTMNFNNGTPQQVTLRIPRDQDDGYGDFQAFVQDRWTLGRATITGGLRYDYFVGYVNDSTLPASRWNAAEFFPGFELQHWHDISPRGGISYDLFGNGKTALKMSVARYVAPESNGTAQANNPQTTIGRTDTRTWSDLNGDYTIYNPDGSVQWAELGSTSNVNFGKSIPSTATRDPQTLNGWDARVSTIEWQAMVQHELTPRVGLAAGYYRRDDGNRTAVDNTLVTNADYTGPFCITAPAQRRPPGRRRVPDLRLVRHHADRARPSAELHDLRQQLRRVHQPVSGRRRQRELPAGRRHVHQHRLQHAAAAARRLRGQPDRQPRSAVLPSADAVPPRLQDLRVAHAAVGASR